MNAVRLPLIAKDYLQSSSYRAGARRVILSANEFELLVIVEADATASVQFWKRLAADYKTNPNLFFAPSSIEFVRAIRVTGATQPVVVEEDIAEDIADPAAIRQITPSYTTMRTAYDRDELVGSRASRAPVLVNDLDPRLNEDSPECMAFPSDPGEATRLINDDLKYFDDHNISWTISSFTPPRLIDDYRYFVGTKLDDGWSCRARGPEPAGLGLVILAHLWNAGPHGLFTVGSARGGFVIARGAIASAYGPVLADKEMGGGVPPLPRVLGNVSVRITDSAGTARLAPLLHTGAGWSQISFLVPPESAVGPAEAAVVRTDGSVSRSNIIVADIAPGLPTASGDGRGTAQAWVTQRLVNGVTKTFRTWQCARAGCTSVDIPLPAGARTTIELDATGFRYAGPGAQIKVTLAGRRLTPVSFAFGDTTDVDKLTVRIPEDFQPTAAADLWFSVNGMLSNVARLSFKAAPAPLSAKVALGRYLFYDKRMSINGTTSCATCHRQELAFTDGLPRARGATGELHPRSAMSLVNLASTANYNWSNPNVHSLEQQALTPMMSTLPVELGFGSVETAFLRAARTDQVYEPLFREAFPDEADPYNASDIAKALAAFERTLVSHDSPYDRYHADGDEGAISESAKRGEILFYLDGGPSCFRCHGGIDFTDSTAFHNTGLYNVPGEFSYPAPNFGLYQFTGRRADVGKFKAPTLRNIALTAPYMHDGSIATLEEVIDHYAAGGRTITQGPWPGIGRDNPARDKFVHGFSLTPRNRADLVAFLRSLSDETFIHNPAFSNPWQ
jgi:cytochrome c peroxidase